MGRDKVEVFVHGAACPSSSPSEKTEEGENREKERIGERKSRPSAVMACWAVVQEWCGEVALAGRGRSRGAGRSWWAWLRLQL